MLLLGWCFESCLKPLGKYKMFIFIFTSCMDMGVLMFKLDLRYVYCSLILKHL